MIEKGDKVKPKGEEYIATVIGKLGIEEVQLELPHGNVVWKFRDELEEVEGE